MIRIRHNCDYCSNNEIFCEKCNSLGYIEAEYSLSEEDYLLISKNFFNIIEDDMIIKATKSTLEGLSFIIYLNKKSNKIDAEWFWTYLDEPPQISEGFNSIIEVLSWFKEQTKEEFNL